MSAGVTLISGQTGSGKTSLLATLAEWTWKQHKKVTRLYTCDGGGWGSKVQSLVDLGIMQVWRMRTRAVGGGEGLIEETCMRASQGWWPRVWDPKSGESPENVELVPPTVLTYFLDCAQGHVVKQTRVRSALSTAAKCPTCSAMVTLQDGKVRQVQEPNVGFETVGAIAVEGLTSMSDWIMMSLADRTGRNEIGGEKPALGGPIRSGDMQFGSNNRAHYGFAQTQAEKWLLNSSAIPGLVMAPVWTCLESRVDETTALPFYAPSIAGQAKSGKVPQWVGNYLGTQIVVNEKGKREWRLYLTEYRGEDGYPHPYKIRAEAGTMTLPEFLVDAGAPFTGFNLGPFLDLLEAAKQASLERAKNEFPDAPGLPLPTLAGAAAASSLSVVAPGGNAPGARGAVGGSAATVLPPPAVAPPLPRAGGPVQGTLPTKLPSAPPMPLGGGKK